jgi:hypothetical protein
MSVTWAAEYGWLSEPDLREWVAASRLNLLRGLPEHAAEPMVQIALQRYVTHVGPAIERMRQLDGDGSGRRPAAAAG